MKRPHWDRYLSLHSVSPPRCCGPGWALTADRERWWAGRSLPGPSPDPCSWRRRPSPRCCSQTSCSSCKSWSHSTHLKSGKRCLNTVTPESAPGCFCAKSVPLRCLRSWNHTNLTGNAQVSYRWRCLPGSSWGSKLLRSVFSLYQSKMRPTKADTSVTFASAQATAWAKENSRVMLQWMPCFSSSSLLKREILLNDKPKVLWLLPRHHLTQYLKGQGSSGLNKINKSSAQFNSGIWTH